MGVDQTNIRRQSNTICLAMICYIVAGRLLGTGLTALIGVIGDASESLVQIRLLASYTLSICVPLCMLAKDSGVKAYAVAPEKPVILKGLGVFFACYFTVAVLNTAASGLLELVGYAVQTAEASLPATPSAVAVYTLRYTLFPACLEELLFRGFILSRLRVFGDRFAIIVSSLLFAAVHLSITQFAGIFILSVLFGWLMVESKSILPGIVLHLLNNACALTFTWLRAVMPAYAYQSLLTIVFLLCGVAALTVFIISIVRRPHVLLGARTNPFYFFKSVPAAILAVLFIVLMLSRIEGIK